VVRYLGWAIAALAALIIIAFAVANRGAVLVSFAPMPFALEIPLFAVALGALALGLLAGALAKLAFGRPHRRIARARLHRIRALEREVASLRRERTGAAPVVTPPGSPPAAAPAPGAGAKPAVPSSRSAA
jgi:uncharacterized integral membrane protein